MSDLNDRVHELCASPAGCAFLLMIEAAGLQPAEAARPAVAIEATANAQRGIGRFEPDHDWTVATVLAEGPRLRALARSLLAEPAAAWLYAPLDRTAQLWISDDGAPPDPSTLLTPSAPSNDWECYAQKPANNPRGTRTVAFFTSTAVDGTSSMLAGGANYAGGDWEVEPPVQQYRLTVAPSARVFEVDGPAAWHRLCVAYPATRKARPPAPTGNTGWSPYHGAGSADDDDRLVPDWSAVARDWDGVHMSLGGVLAAEQVRVESPAGWTEHWGWHNEQTLWLRWCFTAVERLPLLTELPPPPVRFDWPDWLRQRRNERIRQGSVPGAAIVTARVDDPPRR